MELRFRDKTHQKLEIDAAFSGGFPSEIVKAYRSRVNFIRQAQDERDLYSMKSFRFEKLKGSRSNQRSIRLNDQWRLILEFEGVAPSKTALIVGIEDYYR